MTDRNRKSQALWITGSGNCELRVTDLPECAAGEVVVSTLYSAVSRGTESLVFSGGVPADVASLMRAPHQEGEFPWPVKYGYCNVGRVTSGPAELLGRAVFTLYPHQDLFAVPGEVVTLIPDSVPLERAALAANMETALNAVWDAKVKAGDRVTIVGGGVVGCLVAFLASGYPGTEVELVDVEPSRAAVAAELGCAFRRPAEASGGRDVVFHASACSSGLETALSVAGQEAELVELSWYGDQPVSAPLGLHFHPRRLRIRCSQVGQLPAEQKARWSYKRRLRKALELCEAPELDCLISSRTPFMQLASAYSGLLGGGGLCHLVVYDQ